MKSKRFWVYLKLLIRPICVGSLMSCAWYYFFFLTGLSFLEADESAFTDVIIGLLGMFHAIIAGGILNKVWGEAQKARHCIRVGDRETFVECKDDRIPGVIHLLLGSMSLIIQAHVMMIHFVGAFGGIASSFSMAFVLTLYWEVATSLDDPLSDVWDMGEIPPDWLSPK